MSNSIINPFLRQGEVGLPPEEKFGWKAKKFRGFRLCDLYEAVGEHDLATRAVLCSTSLNFQIVGEKRKLTSANFCRLRLCPICSARKAKKMAWALSQVMNSVEADYHARFLFLTLTVKNCKPQNLSSTLDALARGWRDFHRLKPFANAVHGWFRAIEITRNAEHNTYHPHIHAILAVSQDYFSPGSSLWMGQKLLRKMWQKSMNLLYDPGVWICKTGEKPKGAKGTDIPSQKASREAAKYATKDSEFIDSSLPLKEAALIAKLYTYSLFKRRMTGYGGWMRDKARELKVENAETSTDLVHIDESAVREDVADLVEVYNWHWGVKDWVLTDVAPADERFVLHKRFDYLE